MNIEQIKQRNIFMKFSTTIKEATASISAYADVFNKLKRIIN
jgi:hypothetical protein